MTTPRDNKKFNADEFFKTLKFKMNGADVSMHSLLTDANHSKTRDGLILLLDKGFNGADWDFLKETYQLYSQQQLPSIQQERDHIKKYIDPSSLTEMNLNGEDAKKLLNGAAAGVIPIAHLESAIKTVFNTSIDLNVVAKYGKGTFEVELEKASQEISVLQVKLAACNVLDVLAEKRAGLKVYADTLPKDGSSYSFSSEKRAASFFHGTLLQVNKFEEEVKSLLSRTDALPANQFKNLFEDLNKKFIESQSRNAGMIAGSTLSSAITGANHLSDLVSDVKHAVSQDKTSFQEIRENGGDQGMKAKISQRLDQGATVVAKMEIDMSEDVTRSRSSSMHR